jgi:hypothetical protein
MADGDMKPGDIMPARVSMIRPMLAQVVAREKRGVIYGGAAGKLSVGDHVKIRIVEVNGSNGYAFTAALLG